MLDQYPCQTNVLKKLPSGEIIYIPEIIIENFDYDLLVYQHWCLLTNCNFVFPQEMLVTGCVQHFVSLYLQNFYRYAAMLV